MASDNPSIHYRVLKEHTPTSTTSDEGALPVSWCFEVLTPSPEQLFQRTRPVSRLQPVVAGVFAIRSAARVPDYMVWTLHFPRFLLAPGSCSLRCNKKVTHVGTGRQIAWSEAQTRATETLLATPDDQPTAVQQVF